jgi:hypothetical protein
MAIRFACTHCGHTIELGDHLAGAHGHCKHCGEAMVVPHQATASGQPAPMRLRPIAEEGQADEAGASPLRQPLPTGTPADPYNVLGESGPMQTVGQPPKVRNTLLIRLELKVLRKTRNWLYVVSVVSLGLAAYGYFLQIKSALHWGIMGVVASNISMLVVGVAYLVSIPFKEGLLYGLGNLLCPPYAVYYWVTRWSKMKKAVLNTVGSFLPIVLVALAYFLYEEAPVIEKRFEAELPGLEKKFEAIEKPIHNAIDPGPGSTPPGDPGSEPPPSRPRRRRSGGF